MSFMLSTPRRVEEDRERRYMLGGPFLWNPAPADFASSSIIPPPAFATGSGGTESSLQKVAVWACVNLTAAVAQMLPANVYRDDDNGVPVEQPMPTWVADLGGDGHGLPDWCAQFIYAGMLRGNNFAAVPPEARDGRSGLPRMLPLAHPDDVQLLPARDGDGKEWDIAGTRYDLGEVWHNRVNPVPGWVFGLSPVTMHALTIGTGIAAAQFGLSWFRDGAHPSSLLTTDKDLSEEKATTAKKRFVQSLRGRREPAVLGNGWKWQAVQINPNESQFLETANLTSAECCRIFGPAYAEVLGYETGGSMTYSNREQRTLDLLTFALDPWLTRIENLITNLLPGDSRSPTPTYFRFERNALLRTDILSRFKAYNIGIASHFYTDDEVRLLEKYPPLTAAQRTQIAETSPSKAVVFDQNGAKV